MGEKSGAGGAGGGRERAMETKAPSTPSTPSGGTVFGVDGVSKTGSTAQDAAIGFTAGEGTGKPGSNFAALSGATTEQTDKAVAAAKAAQKAGTSPQAAAAAAIGAPAPASPISKALGLDSPYARPTTAADEALIDAFFADEVLGAPIPQSKLSISSKMAEDITGIGQKVSGLSNLALSRRVNAPAFNDITSDLAIEELSRRAAAGDIEAQRSLSKAGVVMAPPQKPEISADTVLSGTGLGSFISGAGETRPMSFSRPQDVTAGAAPIAGTGLGTFTTAAGEVRPGATGETYGFATPTDLMNFRSDVARIGRGLKQTPSLLGYGLGRTILSPESFLSSMDRFLDQGARYNPESGNLELATDGGKLQMNRLGNLTYSGMPDASYTGPYANLVNPVADAQNQGPDASQAVTAAVAQTDPCPEGYTLVDGACQPVSPDVTAPDSRFTLPPVGMTFQPTTVATPVQQINPFVLSPTGAALGRQI